MCNNGTLQKQKRNFSLSRQHQLITAKKSGERASDMAEELSVVLRRTNENSGLGFSLLGTAGLPPIIYDIVENSPAAESGEVCYHFCEIQTVSTRF